MPQRFSTRLLSLVICLVQIATLTVSAQSVSKLSAFDRPLGAGFGSSASIDGTRLVVGAPEDDEKDTSSGSAYVYSFRGAEWVIEEKLVAYDGAAFDAFGASVSIRGDLVVVGAPEQTAKATRSGSAYVYRFNGAEWAMEQRLAPEDGGVDSHFGRALSISGERLVVGAPGYVNGGDISGSAYVYRFDGTEWAIEEKLIPDDGAERDMFGGSVSILGDRLVVGAVEYDNTGNNSGAAYVYRFNGTAWGLEEKLESYDGAAHDRFGASVSLSDDRIVIGATGADDGGTDSGSTYVYIFNGTEWELEEKLEPYDGAVSGRFGGSVSISGDRIVVGAVGDDDNGNSSGAVYVYHIEGAEWPLQEIKLVPADDDTYDHFGGSASISGDRILAGASNATVDGNGHGSAYVYDLSEDANTETEEDGGVVPSYTQLDQNYPNPFRTVTTVAYALKQSEHVTLEVFDALGRTVATLADDLQSAGQYRVTFDAHKYSGGVYLYRLRAGNHIQSRLMTLMK